MEKRGLGKGLTALIPEKREEVGGISSVTSINRKNEVVFIPIEQIQPNPYQPRENFNAEDLEELIASIKEKGLIQPILVRNISLEKYELIAGERRLRAAKSLNIKEMPSIVKNVKEEESLEIALIENIQRQNLNSIEEARAYKHLIEQFGYTQDRIAQSVGKARVSIANTLRLLKLPLEIQDMINRNLISFAHGKLLLEIEEAQNQQRLAKEAVSRNLSVKELGNLILRSRKTKKTRSSWRNTSNFKAIEEELQQILGTKVKVISGRKRGVVYIEFYSQEDLERIYKTIKR